MAYNEDMRIFSAILADRRFNKIEGACYVSVNSTHFVQTGGELNGQAVKAVYLVELTSDFRSFKYFFPKHLLKLKLYVLPPLNTKRMYHGCSTSIINDRLSVIVAGGIGEDGNLLSSIEYFSLQDNEIKIMPKTYSEQVVFSNNKDNKDSIHFGSGLRNVTKLINLLA